MGNVIDNLEKFEGLELEDLDIDLPEWLEACKVYEPEDVDAISYGGCASGACMPAVTYWQANEIMSEHGDDVLDYIEEQLGEVPKPPNDTGWRGIAVFYLSSAIELWCHAVADQLNDMDDDEIAEFRANKESEVN